jgi:hypothetical protein
LIENYEIEYDSLDPENAAAIIRARRPAEQSGKSKEKELQKQSQKKSAGPKKNIFTIQQKMQKASFWNGRTVAIGIGIFLLYVLFGMLYMISQML